jgi:hypothetical protein
MHRHNVFELITISFALGCGAPADKPARALHVGDEAVDAGTPEHTLPEGTPDNAPSLMTAGRLAPRVEEAKLQIEVQDAEGKALSEVALPCPSGCLEVEAAAQGGYPPYQYLWDDGSTERTRKVCSGGPSMLAVSVTDTATRTAEFSHDAQRAMTQLTVKMPACATPNSQGTVMQPSRMCHKDTTPTTCMLPGGIRLPEEVSVDIQGATEQRFGHGAMFPPGKYRIEYVTGCDTFGDPMLCGWTVHGSTSMPGLSNCFIIGGGTTIIGVTPGTTGYFVDPDPMIGGAFMTYDECVAANCDDPPMDFDFAGGTLGVQRDGGGTLGAIDDLGGDAVGGKSPTFRLSRLDACP